VVGSKIADMAGVSVVSDREEVPDPAREALDEPHLDAEELEREIGDSEEWDEASEDDGKESLDGVKSASISPRYASPIHHKTVILSEALRRSIPNRGLYGAESKDPGDACWQMLWGSFPVANYNGR
jgi:hypothetical protein